MLAHDANPILVEVTRGDMVESFHRGAVAVVDARGRCVHAWGDVERPVYGRSAIKPLQALALVETGAAERFELGDAEIALACASHRGEAAHVDRVRQWLRRVGLSEADLECGAHPPRDPDEAARLLRSGRAPSPVHNNCSGKHAGFLTTAAHLGEPTRGYVSADHPVQRRVRAILESMSGTALVDAPLGVDGCGIPVVGMSLRASAFAMARLGNPAGLPAARVRAVERICRAMWAQPHMVAGTNRLCTVLMQALPGKVLLKTGAEGVYTAVLPEQELGVALKIDDGAGRAAAVAVAAVLRYVGQLPACALAAWLELPNTNVRGASIGVCRPAATWSITAPTRSA